MLPPRPRFYAPLPPSPRFSSPSPVSHLNPAPLQLACLSAVRGHGVTRLGLTARPWPMLLASLGRHGLHLAALLPLTPHAGAGRPQQEGGPRGGPGGRRTPHPRFSVGAHAQHPPTARPSPRMLPLASCAHDQRFPSPPCRTEPRRSSSRRSRGTWRWLKGSSRPGPMSRQGKRYGAMGAGWGCVRGKQGCGGAGGVEGCGWVGGGDAGGEVAWPTRMPRLAPAAHTPDPRLPSSAAQRKPHAASKTLGYGLRCEARMLS